MRKMITLTLISFVLCSATASPYAHQKRVPKPVTDLRLNKNMPTVYITFERAGKRRPLEEGEGEEGVWLRIHNNMRWPLRLDMNGVPKEYGDAALLYDVLAEGKAMNERQCHVCSSNELHAGRTLLFSLPREDLVKGGGIRIRFSYGWEHAEDVFADREPQHFVYFYSANLPSEVRGNNR